MRRTLEILAGDDFGEQTTTTTGVLRRSTAPVNYPGPFMFPILPKVSLVPAADVKARSACLKAMQAYASGKKSKKEVDRICGGLGK